MTPKRIQRRRVKGWRLPANTVCVTRPGKWGNPYKVGEEYNYEGGFKKIENTQMAVNSYQQSIKFFGFPVSKEQIKRGLKGKNLACWCPLIDKNGNHIPCHADILLKIANE